MRPLADAAGWSAAKSKRTTAELIEPEDGGPPERITTLEERDFPGLLATVARLYRDASNLTRRALAMPTTHADIPNPNRMSRTTGCPTTWTTSLERFKPPHMGYLKEQEAELDRRRALVAIPPPHSRT